MDTKEKVRTCGTYADEKKAKDVLILELMGLTDIADYFLLASGTSERHVRTISEYVETNMKDIGVVPYSVEGYNDGRWVIIDYQNVIVHIFLETLRELYDLESLWIEAKRYRIDKENKISGVGNEETKA
ncbi:MAG: ribosome silencing factor [Proteobacteria bacterium]|nr:ribosome silencing factor [Pseudomonadota bacterium]